MKEAARRRSLVYRVSGDYRGRGAPRALDVSPSPAGRHSARPLLLVVAAVVVVYAGEAGLTEGGGSVLGGGFGRTPHAAVHSPCQAGRQMDTW